MTSNRYPAPSLLAPLAATFAMQTLVSAVMFGVAVVAPVAAPDLGLDPALIGAFMAVAYSFGTLAGLMTGALARRTGETWVCQLLLLSTAAGGALLALGTPLAAVAAAVLLGLGYGPVNPVTTDILSRVSPPARRPLVLSIKQTGMPAGAAISGVLLPALSERYNWETALLVLAGACALLAVGMGVLRVAMDAPKQAGRSSPAAAITAPLELIRKTATLSRLAVCGLIFAGTQVAIATYFVVYLTEQLAISLTHAGLAFTVLQLSAVAGRLLWGAVASSRVGGATVLPALGMATAVVTLLLAQLTPASPHWALLLLAAALGASSHGWNGVYFAEVARVAPAGRVSDAAGGVQFASLAGVAVTPPAFAAVALVAGYPFAFASLALCAGLVSVFLWRARTST